MQQPVPHTEGQAAYNPGGSSQGNKYYCGRCGKEITYGNSYCPNCGARIDYSGGSCLPNAELTVGGPVFTQLQDVDLLLSQHLQHTDL